MIQILRGILIYIFSSPSNKGQKLYRLQLAFLWQAYKRIVGLPIISKLDNNKLFILYPQSTNSTANIYVRTYEAEYIYFLRKHLPDNGVMLDIGAHMGIYSLLLADKFNKALCLEPADDNFRALENNLFLNRLHGFHPIKIAASNKNGFLDFTTNGVYSGTNTVSESGNGNKIQAYTIDFLIQDYKLDISEISFIKIDTEGYEYNVLQGMSELLTQNKALLILTENSSYFHVKKLYQEYSYKMFAIDSSGSIKFSEEDVAKAYNYFAVGPMNPLYLQIE